MADRATFAPDDPGRGGVRDEGRRKRGSRFRAKVVIGAVRKRPGKAAGFAEVTREAEVTEAIEKALGNAENFELLVRSVKDYAILLLDTDGRVKSWNEGAVRINGYTAEEILGQSFRKFYPEEAIASAFPERELEEAAREGRFEDENWRIRKDGSRYWANVVITALRDDAGELVGYGKVARDLTARREAEEQARRRAAEEAALAEAMRRSDELATLNERLQQSNCDLQAALEEAETAREAAEEAASSMAEAYRQLDQFAYVASHDLKAPLRGIANLAQWIQDDLAEKLDDDSTEHLRLLHGRVQRMEALIDGILAYSRAGRVTTAPEVVDTGKLVRDIIELIAPPEEIRIRIPADMPTLSAELVPLQQVFMNLIGNAVKYGSAGGENPVVELEWQDLGTYVRFGIRDNGPGIAPQFQERVWGIFQTLASRDKVEGTGVGLAIVRKIVESRGGSVTLESTPGQGAAFHFSWPKTSQQGATQT